jgi:hypothetical protein
MKAVAMKGYGDWMIGIKRMDDELMDWDYAYA